MNQSTRPPPSPVPQTETEPEAQSAEPGGAHSRYALGVLTAVCVLYSLDRQVVTILSEDIKASLGLTDAQIGFLSGTAFAVFHAVVGIPLGRLADVWNRRSLIAIGVGLWSVMTAASGCARAWGQLAVARMGVGIGESSANPAAFAMLSDSFPPWARATVLAIYSSGIYIGAGLGLMVGGEVLDRWNSAFPDGGPLGLVGWQAAFLVVGLPGPLLALWVSTLHEPLRGAVDGVEGTPEPHPFRAFFCELWAVVPGLTLIQLWRENAGPINLARNLFWGIALALSAWVMVQLTGNPTQWVALALGSYCAVSWAHTLRLRDPAAAALVLDTPSLRYLSIGFALLAFTGYGYASWVPPYFIRVLGESRAQVGNIIGASTVVAGLLGVTLGGFFADRLHTRNPRGRIQFAFLPALVPIPIALAMLSTRNSTLAYLLNLLLTLSASMWIGAGASTVQDLVLPRMRAVASAFYILILTFIGFAMGPFAIGLISDSVGLPSALRLALVANGLSAIFLLLGARHLERDEESAVTRAERAGEIVIPTAPPGR